MIRPYQPTALKAAAEEIFRQHPLGGTAGPGNTRSMDELLQELTALPGADRVMAALGLSPAQLAALCEALPKQTDTTLIDNIRFMLAYNMDKALYPKVFSVFQTAPLCAPIVSLLAEFEAGDFRPKNSPVPPGGFGRFQSLLSSPDDAIRAFIREVIPEKSGQTLPFSARYSLTGLEPGTTLYAYCFISHLSACDAADYEIEGDNVVARAIALSGSSRGAERMRLNFLKAFAARPEDLVPFTQTFTQLREAYDLPDAKTFGTNADAFRAYRWMYRYDTLSGAFRSDSDNRRLLFWTHYLDGCSVTLYPRQQLITLTFAKYTVVESQTVGPLYVFKNDYFEDSVRSKLTSSRSNVRAWLSKSSEPTYTTTHAQQWESRVTQNAAQYLQ